MLQVGDTLKGVYRLDGVLGEGGFATAFHGVELRTNARVAVKVLKLMTPQGMRQFTREVFMMSHLTHPNIIPIVDCDYENDMPYLVMPLAEKGSLGVEIRVRQQRGVPMPLARTVEAIEQVGSALEYLHQKRIVHRDVKPGNILLPDDYNFWLADLGIAQQLQAGNALQTQETVLSPYFASPEQAEGIAVLASDQYALGVTAFLLLTGRLPFEGDTDTLIKRHKNERPPSLLTAYGVLQDQRIMAILRALDPVVQKALSKKPEDRYHSVIGFAKTFTQTAENAAQEKLTGKSFQGIPMTYLLPTNRLSNLPQELTATLPVIGQLIKKCVELFAEEKYMEVLQLSERIISLNLKNADGWFYKGLALCRYGRWEDTLEPYTRAIELDPTNVVAMRNKADSLNRLGRHTEALVLLEKALPIDPTYTTALNDKSFALDALGRTEEAIAVYDMAIRINPQESEAYYNKGVVLHKSGRSREALTAYDMAIRINPNYSEAYHNKGVALDDLGRSEEAIAAYDIAIRINPNYSEAYHNKGHVLQKSGRSWEALTAYNMVIKLDPQNSEAYYGRGTALDDLPGRIEEALAAYEQAIRLNPQHSKAYNNKAIVLRKFGRFEEALTAYDMAIKFDPQNNQAYANKGFILCLLGNIKEAEISFRQALKDNPPEEVVRFVEQQKKKYQIP